MFQHDQLNVDRGTVSIYRKLSWETAGRLMYF